MQPQPAALDRELEAGDVFGRLDGLGDLRQLAVACWTQVSEPFRDRFARTTQIDLGLAYAVGAYRLLTRDVNP
jgi:hypothetical protein